LIRSSRLDVREEPAGTTLFVSVSGELDMNTVDVLDEHVARQPIDPYNALTVDLRELMFMDSSGLKFLIELHERALRDGWTLRLLTPNHEAATLVLEATGAATALPFDSR
jgi:stage II sporulation protein AA (anti-sigma F factor antagonist)